MDISSLTNGILMLGDLVSFRQVGIKVILTGKGKGRGNLRMGGQAEPDGIFHHFLIEPW
jgi:hypothetical protein